MASEKPQETLTLGKRRPVEEAATEEEEGRREEEEEEREIQELEREVGEMARSILDFRRTTPERLMEAFSSGLVAQRPLLPPQIGAPSQVMVGTDSGAGMFLLLFS